MKDDIERLLDVGLDEQDNNGKTALIIAAWSGDLQTVQYLLAAGANVSITDNLGKNVVHYAASQNNTEVLSVILKTSADKNLCSSGYSQTPLFTPSEVGNIPILRMLLQNGANPNVYDKGKFTPLQWAVQGGEKQKASRFFWNTEPMSIQRVVRGLLL